MQRQIRQAYAACSQAVADELARQQSPSNGSAGNGHHANGNGQPPHSDALLAEFWDGWREREPQQIRFGRDESLDSIAALAERTLAAFQQSEAARPAGQILAVEEELRGSIIPGCPDVLGRVDLIVDAGDALVISDWKTSRSRWSQEQVEDASEQLLLYSELAKDFAPSKPVRIEFVVLTKAKDVAVDCHSRPVLARQVERTKRIVATVWRAIDAELFYPSPRCRHSANKARRFHVFGTPCREKARRHCLTRAEGEIHASAEGANVVVARPRNYNAIQGTVDLFTSERASDHATVESMVGGNRGGSVGGRSRHGGRRTAI